MAVLRDIDLRARLHPTPVLGVSGVEERQRLVVDPLEGDRAIQPASIDLRLGRYVETANEDYDLTYAPAYLMPGSTALAATLELVGIPRDLVGMVAGRSTVGRKFLVVEMAGWIDPGWYGHVTLELHNTGTEILDLVHGMPIAQLVVMELTGPVARPYGHPELGSHYTGVGEAPEPPAL